MRGWAPKARLLALAATARHAMAGVHTEEPDLIVGHGVLGRLLARLAWPPACPQPTVWEIDPRPDGRC
jgi:3-hydroxyethyl bacteriochlorophyllide a dehydrogenase